MKILSALLLVLVLPSCGKFLDKFSRSSAGFTNVSVNTQRPQSLMSSVLNGGLMVYAIGPGGQVFSTWANSESDTISLTVPNGTYGFAAVGWETANLTTTPTSLVRMRCGTTAPKSLTGAPETVTIDLRVLNECYQNNFFTPAIAQNSSPFPTVSSLSLVFCGKGVDLSTRTLSGASSKCLDDLGSSYFYNGTTSAGMDRAVYFSNSSTLFYTASKDSTGFPPAKPYELFSYDFSTGVQTKIAIPLDAAGGATPEGVSHPKKVPGREKLIFIRDSGTSSPDELWIYNLATRSASRISQAPLASSSGVKEFRISESGSHVVYVGDMNIVGKFELFSVAIPPTSDSYAAPNLVSSNSLVSPGVKVCGSCGGDEKYFFKISPGTTNNYVVYSAVQALAGREDLHISKLDGGDFLNGTIAGSGPATVSSGTKISGSELSVAGDFADYFDFSFDGTHLLYHAHIGSGPSERIFQLDITHVAGTSLTVSAPVQVLANYAASPYFKMGKSTQRAVFYSGPGAGATRTMHTLNMANGTNFMLFDVATGSSGYFPQVELLANDSKVVAAVYDGTYVVEIRSANTSVASDWDTGNGGSSPLGTSVSYTGGFISSPKRVYQVSGNGGSGGRYFIRTSDDSKILFRSDFASSGVIKLYYSIVGSAGNTEISGSGVSSATKSVNSFGLTQGDVPYFAAAIDVSGHSELYRTQLVGSPSVVRLGSYPTLDNISEVSGRDEGMEGSMPDYLFMEVNPAFSSTVREFWNYSPANGSAKRISTLSGVDAGGAGRFRVRMLKSPDGVSLQTGGQSDCLKLAASQPDGEQITTSVRLPLGPGPFATAVDIFPLASDCTGTPITRTFATGLGAVTGCAAGSTSCILGSAPNLVLFLKDQ